MLQHSLSDLCNFHATNNYALQYITNAKGIIAKQKHNSLLISDWLTGTWSQPFVKLNSIFPTQILKMSTSFVVWSKIEAEMDVPLFFISHSAAKKGFLTTFMLTLLVPSVSRTNKSFLSTSWNINQLKLEFLKKTSYWKSEVSHKDL